MAKEDEYSQVRMPSGEVRKIHIECRATIGQLGNVEHENQVIGKAGRIASPWQTAARARDRNESRRSSARRRRGALDLGTPADDALGSNDDG